jgi:hypothetical protein
VRYSLLTRLFRRGKAMGGVLPSVADIVEASGGPQRGFPASLLRSDMSVLCLFGAASKGRAELAHLARLRMRNVTVTDEKSDALEAVRESHPSSWRYEKLEPAEACRTYGADCDVIICDGSRSAVAYVWLDLLPLMLSAARKWCVVKVTGEFVAEYGHECDKQGIQALVEREHGIHDLAIHSIKMRSQANGGTHWVTIQTDGKFVFRQSKSAQENAASDFASIGYGRERCVQIRDMLGEQGCQDHQTCHEWIGAFRNVLVRKERAPVFRAYTSARFSRLPAARIDSLKEASAVFDLDRFRSMDEVWEAARVVTTKRGRVNREFARAEALDYHVKPFERSNFVPDMWAVNTSKELRGGKPMRAHYQKTVDQLGGPPMRWADLTAPSCPVHSGIYWGVFKRAPGHRQGDLVVDNILVGYIHFLRYGNHARYSTILGHGEHLKNGIMYLLHFRIVEHYLGGGGPGLRYIMYSGMNSRGAEGTLFQWKQRCLFEPKYLIYDEAGDWRSEASSVPSDFE